MDVSAGCYDLPGGHYMSATPSPTTYSTLGAGGSGQVGVPSLDCCVEFPPLGLVGIVLDMGGATSPASPMDLPSFSDPTLPKSLPIFMERTLVSLSTLPLASI